MRYGLTLLVIGLALVRPAPAQVPDKPPPEPIRAKLLPPPQAAPARGVDRDKLRKLATLPTLGVQVDVGCDAEGRITISGENPDARAEIQKALASLKGDPSDAARYYELWRYHNRLGEKEQAARACGKAVELFHVQLEARPNDGTLLQQSARALEMAGQKTEARALIRQAIKLAPQAWQPHVTGAWYLQAKGLEELAGGPVDLREGMPKLFARIRQENPSPERIARFEQFYHQGESYLERAIALAPTEPSPYLARACSRGFNGLVSAYVRSLRGEKVNNAELAVGLFSPAYRADARQAARLRPNDYRVVGLAAFAEIIAALVQVEGQDPYPKDMFELLPETVRKTLRADLDQLERVAKGKDSPSASGALLLLGFFRYIRGDEAGAAARLERAVSLDPTRDLAWEFLGAALTKAKQSDRLIRLWKERLRHKDTARNRYLFAKILDGAGQPAKAETQLCLALKLDPKDYHANLGLAVMLLKKGDDANALDEARKLIINTAKACGDPPSVERGDECLVVYGIYEALAGRRAISEKVLRGVLKGNNKNKTARAALEALGD